jgi:DNA-binding winged helix-turn-helix (wHTH) protein/tetratricopeptide (TPR) repeat protein
MLRLERFAGTVVIHGREIKLSPKSMQILQCLLEQPGHLVTRKELYAEVWPNQVVTDAALTQAISQLRRELGEPYCDAVRTAPKRGYVFDVKVCESPPVSVKSQTEAVFFEDAKSPETIKKSHRDNATKPVAATQIKIVLWLMAATLAALGIFVALRDKTHFSTKQRTIEFSIFENEKTGVARDMEVMMSSVIGSPPAKELDCSSTTKENDALIIFQASLDTSQFARNPLRKIPFVLCLRKDGRVEKTSGAGDPGSVYVAIRHAVSAALDPTMEGDSSDIEFRRSRAFESYANAKKEESSGLLADASAHYEAALRDAPEQSQISLDYAKNLSASGEIGKARIIYYSIASSQSASTKQRSYASISLAEIEGRYADIESMVDKSRIDDEEAIKLYESFFQSNEIKRASELLAVLDDGRISPHTLIYLKAMHLSWQEEFIESNDLIVHLKSKASDVLKVKINELLASNYHEIFRRKPSMEQLNSASNALEEAEQYYKKTNNYGDLIRIGLQRIVFSMPVSDACELKEYASTVLNMAQRSRAPVLIARARHAKSWVHYRCGELKQAEDSLVIAIGVVDETSDARRASLFRMDYAYVLMSESRLREATDQLIKVRGLQVSDDFIDPLQNAESRIARLMGNAVGVKHACQKLLSELDDKKRKLLVIECTGDQSFIERKPEQRSYHSFMQSIYSMLYATKCTKNGCKLSDSAGWVAEMKNGEVTPRSMMLEDFVYACSSLQGMCESAEVKNFIREHAHRWGREHAWLR